MQQGRRVPLSFSCMDHLLILSVFLFSVSPFHLSNTHNIVSKNALAERKHVNTSSCSSFRFSSFRATSAYDPLSFADILKPRQCWYSRCSKCVDTIHQVLVVSLFVLVPSFLTAFFVLLFPGSQREARISTVQKATRESYQVLEKATHAPASSRHSVR